MSHCAIRPGQLRWLVPLCATAALLSACGGGGAAPGPGPGGTANSTGMGTSGASGTSGSCTSGCGTVFATMTDAPGDFLSYVVAIDSLTLQKADGTSVETVPAATTVDFEQLVDLTELIDAGQIPAGNYVSAVLTLDYSQAQITAEGSSGSAVTLTPVDGGGNPLTAPVQVTVTFDSKHPLVITAANTARIAFDFNVAASSVVNLTQNTVTVSPTLTATVTPSDTKPVRVRGALVSAATAQNDFVVNVQPFWSQTSTGQDTVGVSATTTYTVNGTAYVGAAGLAAVAALPAGTMIASFGTLDTGTSPATFTATSVVAGDSLQSAAEDHVSGTVTAVTPAGSGSNTGPGTVLTVSNATWSRPGGGYGAFIPGSVPVTVGSGTSVLEQGAGGTYSAADISVGQHIDAFGTGTEGSSGRLSSLDASAGQVQLDPTPAWGTISSLTAPAGGTGGSLVLNLQALDGLSISPNLFNFAGTGASSASDANPAAYVVGTGSLSQAGLAAAQPVRVVGFVAPFGSVAPAAPDFTATTLVSYAAVTDYLNVGWGWSGTATAFTGLSASSTSLTLDLASVGWQHFIRIGPQNLDLTTLSGPPVITPASGSGVFTISHADRFKVETFNSFASFISQLASEYTGSVTLISVNAAGSYDASGNTFTASSITVLLSQ